MSSKLAYIIIDILWLAWLAHMFIAARNASPAEVRENGASRLLHVSLLIAGAALFLFNSLGIGWLGHRFAQDVASVRLAGVIVCAAGVAFAVWARHHLGRNWSSAVTLKVDHELVRKGPYTFVRHPMYVGITSALLGTALVNGHYKDLVGTAVLALEFWRKSRIENAFLARRFGPNSQQRQTS